MSDSTVVFFARSCHTIASDRIYRVEIIDGVLYFLRTGGQFNVDRDNPFASEAHLVAGTILATGELLFRKHKREELHARDSEEHPSTLLDIHPHNFKLLREDIQSAVFRPKRWYAGLRIHHGRLALTLVDGKKWEFEFEELVDLQIAYVNLGRILGNVVATEIVWNDQTKQFDKTRRQPLSALV